MYNHFKTNYQSTPKQTPTESPPGTRANGEVGLAKASRSICATGLADAWGTREWQTAQWVTEQCNQLASLGTLLKWLHCACFRRQPGDNAGWGSPGLEQSTVYGRVQNVWDIPLRSCFTKITCLHSIFHLFTAWVFHVLHTRQGKYNNVHHLVMNLITILTVLLQVIPHKGLVYVLIGTSNNWSTGI